MAADVSLVFMWALKAWDRGSPNSCCLYVAFVLRAEPQWERLHLACKRFEVLGWRDIYPGGPTHSEEKERNWGKIVEGDQEGCSEWDVK